MPPSDRDGQSDYMIDTGLGCAGLIGVFVLAMLTGVFNFFQPWLFWISVVLFLLGLARGVERDESLWRPLIAVSFCWLLIPLVFPVYLQEDLW